MQLQGTQVIAAPVPAVWAALNDPAVLQACTPGCKQLTATGEDSFAAVLELGIAAIKGQYKGSLQIAEKQAPVAYRLMIRGEGGPGFVSSSLLISLAEHEQGTLLTYEGTADVGGTIARVGQRVLGGVAKLLMGQFFSALAGQVEQWVGS
ncbi:MAG TPA: carbon monoxide dehydrogenase subunit G [Symbiobacteriaceae bacterium]|nr:carbon monoxide dehydrogenase subunit G [Symbiobacteriaceae bacterium]